MSPKRVMTSTQKKNQSPLKQATLPFRTTKRGATSSKAKGKSISRAKSETEIEGENDNENIMKRDEESEDGEAPSVKEETLDMQDKSGKYRRYYRQVKEQMGLMPPIHAEGQTKVHEMLRVFDNTYDYGPCVGMSRLERWERAEALGLNPPPEVRDILLTVQGSKDQDLVHPVFYGQVL